MFATLKKKQKNSMWLYYAKELQRKYLKFGMKSIIARNFFKKTFLVLNIVLQ